VEPEPALRDGLRTSGMIIGRTLGDAVAGRESPSNVNSPVVALCMSSGRPPGQEELLDSREPDAVCFVCLRPDTPATKDGPNYCN